MRKATIILLLISIFFLGMSKGLSALTFEFSKDKPGVQTFVLQYLRFTVNGENIISRLPMTFFVISYSSDDLPVLVAKVGEMDKMSGLSTSLAKISGGSTARSITGPHGEKIMYNPNRPSDVKVLSSYALWKGWVFIGNKKETIDNLLKLYNSPSDIVKVDKMVSSLKGWNSAGIKIWGDNSNNHLSSLFEGQKKRIKIPLIKDPKKVQYIAGAFTLTESKEMSGSLIVRPVNQQARKDIEGDLRFIGETIRRRLVAIKTPYKGKVSSSDKGIVYEAYIGNYQSAQGQIVQAGR